MKLEAVSNREVGSEFELSARVLLEGERKSEVVWVRWPIASGVPPQSFADPFAAALVIPAMALGEDLVVEGPISRSLLGNLERVRDLVASWRDETAWSHLRPIELRPTTTAEAPLGDGASGLFFTGGVDSFDALYELERAQDPPDRLLFIHGFDIPLRRQRLFEKVSAHLEAAANEIGIPLLTITTNLREITDPILSWNLEHGAALAMVGLSLGAGHRTLAFGSADAYVNRSPYGTHAALDPLWSRESTVFTTVAAGRKRSEKLEALIGESIAQKHLRVCYENAHDAYNCGHCNKCVRTMLQLQVLGALDRFPTLPDQVLEQDVNRLIEPEYRLFLWREMADRLAGQPDQATLAASVKRLISRSEAFRGTSFWHTLIQPGGLRLAFERLRRSATARVRPYWRRRLRAMLHLWRESRIAKPSEPPSSDA